MSFFKIEKGKIKLKSIDSISIILKERLPIPSKSISELFNDVDIQIKLAIEESGVTNTSGVQGALNKIHGDWYELILAISAWNFYLKNSDAHLMIQLPKISSFDVSKLYEEKYYNMIIDLKGKLKKVSSVNLVTSNPDFVIIKNSLARSVITVIEGIDSININHASSLNNLYNSFISLCGIEDIIGYASVKLSLRPDRRLQIPHEGSLMKAIYAHLQTRDWEINQPGIKYYAISASIGEADREALRTVATHSIAVVSSLPQAAVDGVFDIDSLERADEVFTEILLSSNT
ncbi:MAG: Cfr10I/Bse634I family restriction endonuclease [Microscillaceae bacterium]|nr:Cfr10I/Bse634I family restriction endonuclease [Microscillaceae bacterium]